MLREFTQPSVPNVLTTDIAFQIKSLHRHTEHCTKK
jgi:hypothetical protein